MGKLRKLTLASAILLFIGGGAVYAGTTSIFVNERSSFAPSWKSIIAVSKELQAIVIQNNDDGDVAIYKPNVHIVLFDKDNQIFGGVKKGEKLPFSVFVQTDHLKTEIKELKIEVKDPAGSRSKIESHSFAAKSKERFWYRTDKFNYHFAAKGIYSVQVFFKDKQTNDWFEVSEIQIEAV